MLLRAAALGVALVLAAPVVAVGQDHARRVNLRVREVASDNAPHILAPRSSTPRSRKRSGWFWVAAGVAMGAAVIGLSVGIFRVLEKDHDGSELTGDDGTVAYTLRAKP